MITEREKAADGKCTAIVEQVMKVESAYNKEERTMLVMMLNETLP